MKWLDRGHRLSPGSSDYPASLALLNAALGRDSVADAWLEHGRELGHPLLEAEFHVLLFYRGDVEGARELLERLPAAPVAYRKTRKRAALALYENDWKEARRHYRTLYPGVEFGGSRLVLGLLWDPLGLAYALDRLGSRDDAREIAGEVARTAQREMERAERDYRFRHKMAVAQLLLGDTTRALDWLEEAVELGYWKVPEMKTVPTLAPLRDHPRFRALVARMEARLAQERRRVEAEGWGEPD